MLSRCMEGAAPLAAQRAAVSIGRKGVAPSFESSSRRHASRISAGWPDEESEEWRSERVDGAALLK